MSDINYVALKIACDRVNATKNVETIIPDCSSFKIGKTGDELLDRLSNYHNEYSKIRSVYVGTKSEVDDMESYLINNFINHPKCDNKKDGVASNNDSMIDNAEKYQVYVVLNE